MLTYLLRHLLPYLLELKQNFFNHANTRHNSLTKMYSKCKTSKSNFWWTLKLYYLQLWSLCFSAKGISIQDNLQMNDHQATNSRPARCTEAETPSQISRSHYNIKNKRNSDSQDSAVPFGSGSKIGHIWNVNPKYIHAT